MSALNELPPSLFWDVKRPSTDEEWQRCFLFVIERILQRGSIHDFEAIRNYYGDDKVEEVFRTSRRLHPRSLAFGVALFGETARNQACSPIPSHQKLWPY